MPASSGSSVPRKCRRRRATPGSPYSTSWEWRSTSSAKAPARWRCSWKSSRTSRITGTFGSVSTSWARGKRAPRMMRLLLIVFFLEVGLVLAVAPWSAYWERNYFAAVAAAASRRHHERFVRGAVSGLGLVNLAAAVSELRSLLAARRCGPVLTRHGPRLEDEDAAGDLPDHRRPARRGRDADALVESVGAAARAGVHLIQVRERRLDDRVLAALVGRCVRAVRGTRARIARQRSARRGAGGRRAWRPLAGRLVSRRRARVPDRAAGFLVGRSVHSVEDAVRASRDDAVDYLIFGTVFATSSKPGQVAGRPGGAGRGRARDAGAGACGWRCDCRQRASWSRAPAPPAWRRLVSLPMARCRCRRHRTPDVCV